MVWLWVANTNESEWRVVFDKRFGYDIPISRKMPVIYSRISHTQICVHAKTKNQPHPHWRRTVTAGVCLVSMRLVIYNTSTSACELVITIARHHSHCGDGFDAMMMFTTTTTRQRGRRHIELPIHHTLNYCVIILMNVCLFWHFPRFLVCGKHLSFSSVAEWNTQWMWILV